MKNDLSRILQRVVPHFTIILSTLCFVLFAIDRFNSNMMFLANDLTKWILALLCVCAVYCSVQLIAARFKQPAHRRTHSEDAVTIAPDDDGAADPANDSGAPVAAFTEDKPGGGQA